MSGFVQLIACQQSKLKRSELPTLRSADHLPITHDNTFKFRVLATLVF